MCISAFRIYSLFAPYLPNMDYSLRSQAHKTQLAGDAITRNRYNNFQYVFIIIGMHVSYEKWKKRNHITCGSTEQWAWMNMALQNAAGSCCRCYIVRRFYRVSRFPFSCCYWLLSSYLFWFSLFRDLFMRAFRRAFFAAGFVLCLTPTNMSNNNNTWIPK